MPIPQNVLRMARHLLSLWIWILWTTCGNMAYGVTEPGVVWEWGEMYSNLPSNLTEVVGVAAGRFHSVAVKSDGAVVVWGGLTEGANLPPAGLSNVVAVSAGWDNSLALKADGTLVGWGNMHPPPGISGVKAIASGNYHSVYLLSNGTVGVYGPYPVSPVPVGLSNVVAIGAGTEHSLAVKEDGTVAAWGWNDGGQCDVPADLTNVVAASGGRYYSVALKRDGTVVVWGTVASWDPNNEMPAGLTNVSAVVGGCYNILARKRDGTMVAWGYDYYGIASVPERLGGVVAMAANFHNMIITTKPFITRDPQDVSTSVGAKIIFSSDVIGNQPLLFRWQHNGLPLSRATNASLILSNADMSLAGEYQLIAANALGSVTSSVARLTLQLAPGFYLSLSNQIALEGSPVMFQAGAAGALPLEIQWQFGGIDLPGATSDPLVFNEAQLSQSGSYSVRLSNDYGIVNSTPISLTVVPYGPVVAWVGFDGISEIPTNIDDVIALSAGAAHALALQRNGSVVAWGSNRYGQASVPGDLSNIVAIAAGGTFSLALKSDGTVAEWGSVYGVNIAVPAGLSNISAIAAGFNHAMALGKDGTVISWGALTNVPGGLTLVKSVQAGALFSLALNSNGTIVAWGSNDVGQCDVPSGLNDITAIAAGWAHSLALRSNGTVVAWGHNDCGQTRVPSYLSNVVTIAAGYKSSFALKADGSLVAWGDNSRNQTTLPIGLVGVKAIAVTKMSDCPIAALDLPQIVSLPQDLIVLPGETATLSVSAIWSGPLSYQWSYGGKPIEGATNNQLILTNVQASQGGYYRVVAQNEVGNRAEALAYLTVAQVPQITGINPATDQSVIAGTTVYFNASISCSTPFTLQWYLNGLVVPSGIDSMLVITNAQATDAGMYTLVVSNVAGAVTSAPIYLNVHYPPSIIEQPQSQLAMAGSTVVFAVQAAGDAELTYSWKKGTQAIQEATNAELRLTRVQPLDAGSYSVKITNQYGITSSVPAILTVTNSLFDALNIPEFAFITGGQGAWYSQTNASHDGISAAQSGPMANSESAWFETSFTGSGTLTFWWKVSSEEFFDLLSLSLDDSELLTVSGERNWTFESVHIPSGEHLLRWTYSKDESISTGMDAAWVDQVSFTPDLPPVILTEPVSQSVLAGEVVLFKVEVTGTLPLACQWLLNGTNIPNATNSIFKINSAQATDAGDYSFFVYNEAGSAQSQVADLEVRAPADFALQPKNQLGFAGGTIFMQAIAAGSGALLWQWQFNGQNIDGATNTTLLLTNLDPLMEGLYSVEVRNPFGVTLSQMALLTIVTNGTVINFDDLPSSCLWQSTARVSTEYQQLGVEFDRSASGYFPIAGNDCGIDVARGYSRPNFMFFDVYSWDIFDDGGYSFTPQTITFNPPVSLMQVSVGSTFFAGATVTLTAHDESGTPIDTTTVVVEAAMQPVSVSGPNISTVEVTTTADLLVLDDLKFSNAVSAEQRAPLLKSRLDLNKLILFWPSYYKGFFLEESEYVTNPWWRWNAVPLTPIIEGAEQRVEIEQLNSVRFYRLKKCPCRPPPKL